MLIGLIGVRGSGKDTCAEYLVESIGATRIAFADALYSEVSETFGVTVAELQDRKGKEIPQESLALERCKDPDFVKVFLASTGRKKFSAKFLKAPRSPREILQIWGTQYRRRSQHGWDSYWLDKVTALIKAVPDKIFVIKSESPQEVNHLLNTLPDSVFVITDVRFINEARFIESNAGKLIRINRPVRDEEEANLRAKGDPTALHPSATELLNYPCQTLINEEGKPESLLKGLKAMLPELFPK